MTRLRAADAKGRAEAGRGPDHSEALARGLSILGAFGPERRQMTLAETARVADLPRATARRALLTLVHLGLVEADGRLFRLTPRVLQLAAAYLGSNGASTLLQPACERISGAAGETSSAAMLDGAEIVFVAYGQPMRLAPFNAMVGMRLPAHCTALGRVLLAAMPLPALDALLQDLRLEASTPHTLTDPARLREAILAAHAAGYALVDEEAELGFRSVAVPVVRYDGRVVAALNLGAPVARRSAAEMLERFLPLLHAEAAALGAQLL